MIVQLCHEHDVSPYLWFPVLADIPGYEVQEKECVVSYQNERGYGNVGRWEKLGEGDEKFLFACSNNKPAVENIFRIYKNLVGQVDFDGVFLDRIRYPSCTNGFESLFTCFCDFCQTKFSTLYEMSLEPYRQKIADLLDKLKQLSAQELNRYHRLESLWDGIGLETFFEFRNTNVYERVNTFVDYARSKDKQVGLDLYTPSLASFVSQDYRLLSQGCDWIKPMSYCHVIGPAGVPLEICCLIQALQELCPTISERDLIRFFERVLEVPLPESKQEIVRLGIPEEFVARELEKITQLQLPENVEIHPGIEAVKNPHFDLNITEEILRGYLMPIQQDADGVIASWNILYIPDENWEIMEDL